MSQGAGPSKGAFSPGTAESPGLVTGGTSRASDQAYGASGGGVGSDGLTAVGHSIVDTDSFLADDGILATTPDYHTVEKGDTLWDICETYFRDPYEWPKVWSYNDQITNAHWIFPGDRVKLTTGSGPASVDEPALTLEFAEFERRHAKLPDSYTLNRFAYVEDEQLDHDMEVYGGADAKVMMATLDTVYLSYDAANPPIAGERLAVYRPERTIRDLKLRGDRDPKKGDQIGYLVEVVGEAYVTRVSKKSAEARIVASNRPIERGMKVGELRTRFTRVEPTPAKVSESGLVIDTVRDYELSGENQFVIVNFGADRELRRGNMLEVVRMGDEWSKKHKMISPYEEGHPRRIIGNILILQVQQHSAIGVVVYSQREVQIGDHVELRTAEMSDSDEPSLARERSGASGHADGSAGDGKAEASGGFSIGN
jgi:hypothetical protein